MNSPLKVNEFSIYYRYNHSGDYCFEGHTHSAWEINVITKGILNVTYDDRIITLRENMLMICESEVFHRNRVMSPSGAELFVYQFYTDDIPHQNEARVYELDENNIALIRLIADEAEKNAKEVEKNAVRVTDLNYQSVKLLEILLMRLTEKENAINFERHPDERLYQTTISFMKNNISRNICIDDVAKHCHVSPTKIKNVFYEFAGCGIITHFSHMKINEAKRMLKEGMSISEVSDLLGYSSQAYMSLCFKKCMGVTPLTYKKTINNKHKLKNTHSA